MDQRDDHTTASYVPIGAATPGWYLMVAVAEQSSRVIALRDGEELVFGRHASCSVPIDHDGVSRQHARVRRDGDEIFVEDLGSRNGTLVNGAAIAGPRRIGQGDAIAIGPATAVLARSSAVRRTRYVATATELEDRLEIEVDRATRYRRPLGVIVARLDGPTDRVMARADELLASLRRMDLLAERDDDLVIVLPEADASAVAVVAARVRALEGVTVSLGSATLPDDGMHGNDLLATASHRGRDARSPQAAPATPPPAAGDYIAVDLLMKQVFQLATRAAPTQITVLIVGETGVGKEVIAEVVHRRGTRAAGPLVRLNCAAIPETLVESELFGHEKGAFTGATAARPGYFEAAHGGTLFLDEIAELPLTMQPKLLRVLEHRCVVRVGGTKEIPVDVRLVCATNRDLEAEVTRGRFRQDLYFRLGAFVIPVPPLRDRRSDIGPLAARFARVLSLDVGKPLVAIAPAALDLMKSYDWPGNVRELRNTIERAIVLSEGATIEPLHLPERVRGSAPPASAPAVEVLEMRHRIAEVERETVIAALAACNGNQTHAARRLGISRFALIRLMDRHDLRKR